METTDGQTQDGLSAEEEALPVPSELAVETSLTIHALVDLRDHTIVKRAPLWEIQAWARVFRRKANDGDDFRFRRLDLLKVEDLKKVVEVATGVAPTTDDRGELEKMCLDIAEQVPVDETSIEQLRRLLMEGDSTTARLVNDDELYGEYLRKAKSITPAIAVLSMHHWRIEGRPTAEESLGEFYDFSTKTPTLKRTQQGRGDIMTDTTQGAAGAATKETKPKAPSTKQLIRDLFASPTAAYTLDEIIAATGKEKGGVTTAISDLKSEKYCKPGEPLVLHRWTSDSKYRLTEEPESAKPAKPIKETKAVTTQAPAAPPLAGGEQLVLDPEAPSPEVLAAE